MKCGQCGAVVSVQSTGNSPCDFCEKSGYCEFEDMNFTSLCIGKAYKCAVCGNKELIEESDSKLI